MKRLNDFWEITPKRTIVHRDESIMLQSHSQLDNTIIPHSIPLGSSQELSALNISSLLVSTDDEEITEDSSPSINDKGAKGQNTCKRSENYSIKFPLPIVEE